MSDLEKRPSENARSHFIPQDIKQIIKDVAAGNEDPLVDLFNAISNPLINIAISRTGVNRQDAEDLVQEALIKIINPERLATLTFENNTDEEAQKMFGEYCIATIVHGFIDKMRKAGREVPSTSLEALLTRDDEGKETDHLAVLAVKEENNQEEISSHNENLLKVLIEANVSDSIIHTVDLSLQGLNNQDIALELTREEVEPATPKEIEAVLKVLRSANANIDILRATELSFKKFGFLEIVNIINQENNSNITVSAIVKRLQKARQLLFQQDNNIVLPTFPDNRDERPSITLHNVEDRLHKARQIIENKLLRPHGYKKLYDLVEEYKQNIDYFYQNTRNKNLKAINILGVWYIQEDNFREFLELRQAAKELPELMAERGYILASLTSPLIYDKARRENKLVKFGNRYYINIEIIDEIEPTLKRGRRNIQSGYVYLYDICSTFKEYLNIRAALNKGEIIGIKRGSYWQIKEEDYQTWKADRAQSGK